MNTEIAISEITGVYTTHAAETASGVKYVPEKRMMNTIGQLFSLFERYDYVRVALCVVLIASAVLKAHELMTGLIPGHGLLSARWVLVLAVEVELALALWLTSGLYARAGWGVAIACFTGFFGIAVYRALSGEPSCGCFGKVQVNPWATAAFDLAAVIALLASPPRRRRSNPLLTVFSVIVLTVAMDAAAAYAMLAHAPPVLVDADSIPAGNSLVILEPELWLGKPFPLARHIDIGDRFKAGRWIVVLYHPDCPMCKEAIPKYERLSREASGGEDRPHVVLVEMPPYAATGKELVSASSDAAIGRLSDEREWFAETPTVIHVDNGRVVAIAQGKAAAHPRPGS